MKIAAAAFTKKGGETVKLLCEKIGADGYITARHAADGLTSFGGLSEFTREAWERYDAIVFIGACAIAVRAIAPHISDKARDTAVVVTDENCKFAIPILSGHIGGANALARKIAAVTGAEAVITTATDINGKFAVDTFAVRNNLHIGDTKIIKEISSRILEGHKIGLYSDYELKNIPDCFTDTAEAGICISDGDKKPFKITLNLKPKNVVIGVGCRRGCETVGESAAELLNRVGTDINTLCAAASIDVKRGEKGITDFCEKHGLPFLTFSAADLNALGGDFTASEFVKNTVGTDNVCERAVRAAGAEIIVKKTVINGVALALGRRRTEIDFEKSDDWDF